ncbi:MAG: 7TMR-DISM family protein, partial [Chitinophagaceae bacterium]
MSGKYILFVLLISCSILFNKSYCQSIVDINNQEISYAIGGNELYKFEDTLGSYTRKTIINCSRFRPSIKKIPVFPTTKITHWLKFTIQNNTNKNNLFLNLSYANISEVCLYKYTQNYLDLIQKTGTNYLFSQRNYENNNFIFNLNQKKGGIATYYLKIKSNRPIILPISVSTRNLLTRWINIRDLFIGVYTGILCAILLYNLFIYFFVNDKSYLYYVLYLLFLTLSQLTLAGYCFQYFWPNFPMMNDWVAVTFPALTGLTGITFARSFLHTKRYLPKVDKWLTIYIGIYLISIFLSLAGFNVISFRILDFNSISLAIFLLIISGIIGKKGFRSA